MLRSSDDSSISAKAAHLDLLVAFKRGKADIGQPFSDVVRIPLVPEGQTSGTKLISHYFVRTHLVMPDRTVVCRRQDCVFSTSVGLESFGLNTNYDFTCFCKRIKPRMSGARPRKSDAVLYFDKARTPDSLSALETVADTLVVHGTSQRYLPRGPQSFPGLPASRCLAHDHRLSRVVREHDGRHARQEQRIVIRLSHRMSIS